jgi:hypothetical protein
MESDPAYRRMKENQCWEMAGLARQDGDFAEEKRYVDEARKWASGENGSRGSTEKVTSPATTTHEDTTAATYKQGNPNPPRC